MRPLASWSIQAVAWFVIFAAVAMVAAAVLAPRLAGATPYTILTGSMRPSLPPGTLVVIKPAPVDDLRVGDVVTYQLESGKPQVVTHRIVKIGIDLEGDPVFTTRGDTNDVADAKPVRPVQIRGKLLYSVPKLGYVNNFISGTNRRAVTYGVVSLLLGYAAFMFVSAVRDRRNAKRSSTTHSEEVMS
ncbi:MAG TPA: signal peptidase I [Aeromicrobium sp.]|nr:signal peptidase I [Aeromicrobium sp.]HKY57234.1 signal peptidase I [Aeromicrobium sp.]